MIHLWEVATGEKLDPFGGYEGAVYSLAQTFDGRMAAVGNEDKIVRLWETATGKIRKEFAGHRRPVFAVALSPDGVLLASGGEDAAILVWDLTGRFKDGRLEVR